MLPAIVARWLVKDYKPDTKEIFSFGVSETTDCPSIELDVSDPKRIGNTFKLFGSNVWPIPEYVTVCLVKIGVWRSVNGEKKFEVFIESKP